MIRDTLEVPATGAGVGRQFSLSGRITTAIRSRLNPDTISKFNPIRDVPGSGGLVRILGVSNGPPEPEARNFSHGPSPTEPGRA
jgi:hypothetical protein